MPIIDEYKPQSLYFKSDFGGDKAMHTMTSFDPRQLHHYRFQGEPAVTFSIKELKVWFAVFVSARDTEYRMQDM